MRNVTCLLQLEYFDLDTTCNSTINSLLAEQV